MGDLSPVFDTNIKADDCDPVLCVGPAMVWAGDISGPKNPEEIGFVIGHEVVIPGVQYYPDGSGQPDDYDLVEVITVTSAKEAAYQVFLHAFDLLLESAIECVEEDQMYEDLKN